MAAPTRPWCVVPQPRGATSTAGRPSSADPLLVPAPRRGTRSGGIATRTDCARALGATSGHRCLRPIRRRPNKPVRLVGHPWQRGSLVIAVVVAVAVVAAACAAATVIAPPARPLAFPSTRLPTCRYALPLTRPPACRYALPLAQLPSPVRFTTRHLSHLRANPPTHPVVRPPVLSPARPPTRPSDRPPVHCRCSGACMRACVCM